MTKDPRGRRHAQRSGGQTMTTEQPPVPEEVQRSPVRRRVILFARRFAKSKLAVVGTVILSVFVFVGIFGPMLAPHDPAQIDTANSLAGPTMEHPMGTDHYGRDVFSRVLEGARIALIVAAAVPVLAMSVGVPIGLISGYFGGWIDNTLMRFMDSLFAFPSILLALTFVAVFGTGLFNVTVAMAIVFVPVFARITRGSAISAAQEEHVKAAQALGGSHFRVISLHVFPYCISAIMVQATITAAAAILIEASLSFLGVGIQPPDPSWGAELQVAKGYMNDAWWFGVFPGLAIVFAVLGFNLLGDGLRDVLDPRMDPDRE